MKTLISPRQVIRMAFPADACLAPDAISEADIVAAEHRYLRPILGPELHDRLLERASADDEEFIDEHLAAPAAFCTRLLVQGRLDLHLGRTGTALRHDDGTQAADSDARQSLHESVRTVTRSLLHRLSDYLNHHPDLFREYDPRQNVMNRCSLDGKHVQIV